MQTVSTIGLDIAKSVFQVHGVDAAGVMVIRRQLKRRYVLAFFEKLPPCLVGIEACASSHHWSRELQAFGHNVRLMPPAYVKPYVKRQKNDAADAEAICEAVVRANMRFVPTKTPEQQSGLMLHRTRHLFIRQQTSVINAIRAHLAEFGVIAPVGRKGIEELLRVIADPSDKRVPDIVRACLAALGSQLLSLKKQILDFDRMIMAWHRSDQTSKRLNCIPGVGPLLATALVASVPILKPSNQVATSRPGSGSSPNNTRAGVETGSAVSANKGTAICAACLWPAHSPSSAMPSSMALSIGLGSQRCWQDGRPKVAAIALANKLARMAWAMMSTGERYNYPAGLRV
jgi:transposase